VNIMSQDQLISIGEIYREHGVHGDVKVYVYNPDSQVLKKGGQLQITKENGDSFTSKILQIKPLQKWFLVSFDGIDTMEKAQSLRKASLQVESAQLSRPKKGEYYFFDLVGFEVVTPAKKILGKLKGMTHGGGQGVFILETDSGKEMLVPIVSGWICKVEKENKILVIDIPEGLEEINT